MVLRPVLKETTADDILAQGARHLLSCKRDIFVYDKTESPCSTYDFTNNLYTGVVQSTKLLVKGFPNLEGITYDRPESERTTLVKFLTIYNGYMNKTIKEPAIAFERATLKPLFTIATAYTDTKMINPMTGQKFPVQFAVSIYSFNTRVMSSITCNPAILSGYGGQNSFEVIPSHQIDVCDPRMNLVRPLYPNTQSCCDDIPTKFKGHELMENGKVSIIDFESYFDRNNSFTEAALIENAKLHQRLALIPAPGQNHLVDDPYTRQSLDLIDKKVALRNLIVDIIKGGEYSMFENFTMMYETGKDSGFREIKSPFRQYVVEYMNDKMEYVGLEFSKLCERVTEKFGHVRIILHVNDVEHVVRCIFKEGNASNYNSVVTLRMTKLECLQDYITETLYGTQRLGGNSLMSFREQHDLDILNYYSHAGSRLGESVRHEGALNGI